jgi:hypothetical protein
VGSSVERDKLNESANDSFQNITQEFLVFVKNMPVAWTFTNTLQNKKKQKKIVYIRIFEMF